MAQFQHTATRRWLHTGLVNAVTKNLFQHTATRRWLPRKKLKEEDELVVSTHSHPKVAAPYIKKQDKSAN